MNVHTVRKADSPCCQFEVCLCAVGGKTESACCQLEVCLCAVRGKTESLCCQLKVSVCCQRESQYVLLSPLFPANSALVNKTY